MENRHMTQQSFANYIDIAPGTLSGIFKGRTNPTLKIVESIHEKFPNLSLDWLLYGKGQMFTDLPPESAQSSASSAPSLSSAVVPSQTGGAPHGTEGRLDFGTPTPTSPAPSGSAPASSSRQSYNQNGGMSMYGASIVTTKYIDKPQRKITEIRIFYDDQTWESFVPKK